MLPETWQERAACGPDDWPVFEEAREATEQNGTRDKLAVRAAQRVCQTCPVQLECLRDAVELDSWEFRAGTSRRERRSRRYKRLLARPAA